MGIRDNFKKGFVEMLLLSLLADGDQYGYQLSQEIEQRSGGAIQIPEGSLYPTMYKLEDEGYVSGQKIQVGKRMSRVYYHLTPSGHTRLDMLLEEYQIFAAGMERVLAGKWKGARSHDCA